MRLLVIAALLHWILATNPEEHGPRSLSKGLHDNPEENSLLQMQALPARRRGARSTNTTSEASQPMEAVATLYEFAADTLTVAFSDPEPLKSHRPQASHLSFLAKYLLWSLLVVVSSSCAKGRWYTPALKDGGFDADAPSLLPVQVAYLAAGPIGALRSSVLMLIYEGIVEARPLACKSSKTLCLLRAVSNPAGHLSLILSKQDTASESATARSMEHRLRTAIMEAFGKQGKDGRVDLVELARGPLREHLDEIQQGLVEQQLTMSTVTWRTARGLPGLPLCLLLCMGLAQAQHLPGHLGLALPMILLTVVGSLLTNPRLSHRTAHGDKALGFYDIGSVKARGTIELPQPAAESIFLAPAASKEPAPEPAPDAASQSASSEAASVDVAMVFALYGLEALASSAASRPELATLEAELCHW